MSDEKSSLRIEAERWIDGLQDPSGLRGSWRLQVLEHRVSIASDGTRAERPVRLTRFAKGCPWALLSEAERYLLELAPYSGRIVNGIEIPGTFRPTRTRWIRDDQTAVDDQRRSTNENRHTIVQDLVDASLSDGDSVESSEDCVESVTTEYRWDEPSLPDTLPAGDRGITVSLQQVARQEDGTYRYAIVTRIARTRIGTGTVVECTDFRTVSQQDFTNLYGDPAAGFTDGAGTSVQVPAQCRDVKGTSVEWRNLRQNDDCTWNVSVVTTVAKQGVRTERTSSKTTLETRDSVKTSAQVSEAAHIKAYSPSTGKVYEQRSERRPDGLYDNTVSERVEETSAGHVEETRRTVRGATKRTVNRHMASKAPAPSGIGSVVNTRTDSGRYDQEITEVDRNADPVDAGEGCAKTVFEHTTVERTVRPDKPTDHVADAAGGVRWERTSRITEEGSFDVTLEKREELPKTNAQVTVRKTLRGTQRTVVDRNVATPLPETGLAVGETRQSEVTPGGLYNTTKTVATAEAAGEIGTERQETVFERVGSVTSNQASKPEPEADAAGGGRTSRKTVRQTEEGAWDVTVRTVEERSVTDAEVEKSMTLGGLTVRRRHRSLQAPPSDPVRVGESVSYRITDGGLYDIVSTAAGVSPAGSVSEECAQDNFSHRHSETRNETDVQNVETQFSPGRIVRKSGARTANGTASNTTETVTAKAMKHRYQYEREDGSVVHVIQYRNQPSENVGYPDGAYALTVHDSVNPFGLHDGTATWMTNVPGRGASMADYKFMRSGPRIDVIAVKFDRRNRWRRHQKRTVQIYHVRGSAYVDYLSDEEQANPGREDAGILAVRLVNGPYVDSIGTVCAEWKYAVLSDSTGWETCTASCRHGDESQDMAAAVSKILDIGGFNTRALGGDANEGMKDLAQALRELPVVLSAAKAGATPAAGEGGQP